MSNVVEGSEQENLPADFPGRMVEVPHEVTHLVFGIFGVQSRQPSANGMFIDALRAHCRRPSGPTLIERAHYVDPQGYACDVLLAYWLDREAYQAWMTQPAIADWWTGLPRDPSSDVGYWREVLMTPKERFEFAGGNDHKAASARFLPLVPTRKVGYWGAYRDRLPASAYDHFDSPSAALPAPRLRETRGKRLRVEVPENICFIREGQGWSACGPEERTIWSDKMEWVVSQWIAFLRENSLQTGCISMRDCRKQQVTTGAELEQRSQLGFLLSLGHIKHAARTQPTHLAVRNLLIQIYKDAPFTPQLHLWVEVHILPKGALETEYLNCHPHTGFLPYFETCTV